MACDIMIVDDEEITASTLKLILERHGLEADSFCDPIVASEVYSHKLYNIVLIDVIMPRMTGVELIKKIKNVNPLCNVIVITAFSNMERVVECIEAGAIDYITKPITDISLLLSIVDQTAGRVERWKDSFGLRKESEEHR